MELIIPAIMVCFLAGSSLSVLPKRGEWNFWGSLALAGLGSLIIFGCGVYYSIWPMERGNLLYDMRTLMVGLPPFSISVYADRLAALFLILTGGLSIAAVLHMSDCLAEVADRNRIAAAYNLFILSVAFTVLANTVFMFLFALECITLSYAYLVLFQHNRNIEVGNTPEAAIKASKTAFQSYLIFEHAGSILLLIALVLISVHSPGPVQPTEGCRWLPEFFPDPLGFDFDSFRCFVKQGGEYSDLAANLIFLLALFGFGIKAGMFPAHVWVPLVHPFSPSSFPALMSTVGLAVSGLYGMYRVFFEFSGHGQFWWGLLVLLLAGATALAGAFYAMLGRDLKTALASYSVGQVGIILVGIGLALIYRWAAYYAVDGAVQGHNILLSNATRANIARSFQLLSVLALIASLYHLANQAVFQSLLYFAAGAIEDRTGTVILDRLGGLVKRYPWTSAAFLVGALSIAGLPPFNGFVSAWLTLQAMFGGMNLFLPVFAPRVYLLVGLVVTLLCLALAFALTALGFVKIAGEALLGAPRDREVAQRSKKGEASWRIRAALVALAGLCLAMGLLPAITARGIGEVVHGLSTIPDGDALQASGANLAINLPVFQVEIPDQDLLKRVALYEQGYQTRLSGRILWGTAGMLAFPFILALARRFFKWGRDFRLRRGNLWTGGTPYQPEVMQVTGSAFSAPVWLASVARKEQPSFLLEEAGKDTDAGKNTDRVFPVSERISGQYAVPEVFRILYDIAIRRLLKMAQRFGDWAEPGDIRRYLFYIFIMFLIVLAILSRITG